MNNNYIPNFILNNKQNFELLLKNSKDKNYDEFTINLKNLINSCRSIEDLGNVFFYISTNNKFNNISKKTLQIEIKKSPLFDGNFNTNDELCKTYWTSLCISELQSIKKKNIIQLFIAIPLSILYSIGCFIFNDFEEIWIGIVSIIWMVRCIQNIKSINDRCKNFNL